MADLAMSQPPWGRALLIAVAAHALALIMMLVRIIPAVEASTNMPAIAVEMASPSALPAPVHDVPTPRQIEAPEQTAEDRPQPKKLPFDRPVIAAAIKPEVVLPPKAQPQRDKANPLPPAPTTTELAAPNLKPDVKTAALVANGAATGKAAPDAVWDARVRARIELTKRYPGLAARQNQQDAVAVLLSIDRSGKLVDARIRTSRGYPLLDAAALEAVRRAAPYPKPPSEIAGDPVRLSVTVRFAKRGS